MHRDHLGTPIASSTAAGVYSGSTTIPDSFGYGVGGFTGREYDSYLDLQYSRARMYDPKLGRFISEDPIGFAGGDVNLYGYVWNNPLHFTDPYGESAFDAIEALNEARWRAEQRALEALEVPLTFTVGFGDTASLGITRGIRDWQGIDTVNWDCSTAYNAGGWAAVVVEVGTGVAGITKAGLKFAGRQGLKNTANTLRRTLDDEAKNLVKLNGGRNRVTLRTDKFRLDIDLQGRSHGPIATPHTKLSLRNMQAPGNKVVYNTTNKQALLEGSTIQDLRLVRRYLRSINR